MKKIKAAAAILLFVVAAVSFTLNPYVIFAQSLEGLDHGTPPTTTATDPPKQEKRSDTAAIINGERISLSELDDRILSQLREIEGRIYQVRQSTLENLISEKLFMSDARQHGRSPEEYLNMLVAAKPITEANIEAIYSRIKEHTNGVPADQAKDQIRQNLLESRRRETYLEKVRELRAQAKIEVLLAPSLHLVNVVRNGGEPRRGTSGAKVTIIEFSDFQCPFCKSLQQSLDKVMASHPGQIELIFKHLPLTSHDAAQIAAEAAVCAHKQGKFWQLHDQLFSLSPKLDRDVVLNTARAVVSDTNAFDRCIATGGGADQIRVDVAEASRIQIDATPALVINGRLSQGFLDAEALEQIVSNELSNLRDNRASADTSPLRP